jgi:hypothetical protein
MINLVLDTMIPGDIELGMPAASTLDFELYQLKHKIQCLVEEFLQELTWLAQSKFENEFEDLNFDQRLATVNACKAKNVRLFSTFLTHCFRAYYSDAKVLNLIAAGSVPPFPVGNVLESDNWDLLEPVYERGRIYRSVDAIL